MSLTFTDEDVARCASLFPSGDKKYRVIYADPPWEYSSNGNLKEKPYRTMKRGDLRALPVPSICDADCALFLWTANPLLDEALLLMKAWGFQFKTVYKVWTKRNVASGTPAITPGYWSLSSTELLLVGARGSMQKYKVVFNDRQEVAAPRGNHSEKPASIREDIRRLLNVENRIELFSRHVCDGWDAWGLDVPGFVHYSDHISGDKFDERVSATLAVNYISTGNESVRVDLRVTRSRSVACQSEKSEKYTAREPVHAKDKTDKTRPDKTRADKTRPDKTSVSTRDPNTAAATATSCERVPVVHKAKGLVRGGARPFRSNFAAWWNSYNRTARDEVNRDIYTVPTAFLDANPDIKKIVCKSSENRQ
jgi:N6-adenosine-specific RNA methylase IME4